MPRASIIIPAYNASAMLHRSLGSSLGQTVSDVEVIVINDCSTDDTLDIAREYASNDSRVIVLSNEENSGPMVSRSRGVEVAKGDYIFFLDADDSLVENAVEVVLRQSVKKHWDIVHFDMTVENVGLAPDADVKATLDFARPYNGQLFGQEVIRACFEKHQYGWNLANKAFCLSVCKKANEFIPEKRMLRGEDGLVYFILAYFAESYIGLPGERLYHYFYGSGEDGKSQITLDEFRHMCSSSDIAFEMRRFLESQGEMDGLGACYEEASMTLASHAARQYRLRVPEKDRANAFEIMKEAWGSLFTAIGFSRQFWNAPEKFARDLQSAPTFRASSRPVKTIGTYYHHYLGGGTEKVQQFLIKLWRQMGLRVVLFVDNMPDPDQVDIASEADEFYLLPQAVRCTSGDYKRRAQLLEKAARECDIDLLVYHYYDSQTLMWDMTIMKCLGISTLVYYHNSFSYLEKFGRPQFAEIADVYALADGVITLSAVDSMWWQGWGSRVFETVSPFVYDGATEGLAPVHEKNILCLGRVAPDKHTDKVIEIFEAVKRRIPDATLTVVGGSGDKKYVEYIDEKIRKSPYSESIERVNWTEDPSAYFSSARVFLMASDIEGYPLALLESLASGVPAVMYDLPYLTLVREARGRGLVTVPFDECNRAAYEVERFLVDDDYYLQMRAGALESTAPFLNYDFPAFWNEILASLANPGGHAAHREFDTETHRIMQSVFFDTYKRDLAYKRSRIAALEKDSSKKKKMEASPSWRVGRMVTWAPRKAKRVLKKLLKKK